MARLERQGRRCGILHLTRGERGTRGTPEQRRMEAQRAAEILGAVELLFLDCGDGTLRRTDVEEDSLIELFRRLRPELVLAPAPRDRHPDHGRAHRLVMDSCYYAGLAKRAPGLGGEPHRPALVLSYMQHDPFEPSVIVDVSSTWETKLAALEAYGSQLHRPGSRATGPGTKVSSPEFAAAIAGRARHFGLLIGAAYGEPFWSPTPIAVPDLWSILPVGLH